jgi:hypothetical protein
MAKRSDYERESERVKVSDEEKKEERTPETVRLVLLKQVKLNYKGPVTGKRYVFGGAGAEVDVDKEDAEIMMSKMGGKCCEGSGIGTPTPYFAEV